MSEDARAKRLRDTVFYAQRKAAAYIKEVVSGDHPDSKVAWVDSSVRTRAALALVQGAMALERVRQQSTVPKVFGVVMMQGREEDHAKWEQMAADVGAGKPIEVEAKPVAALPPKEPSGS